jgi:hypothetical protein
MKILQKIASLIWNFHELLGISLGKLAPYIFGLMIGRKPQKNDKRRGKHDRD